jgi:hypothetical protein
MSCVCGDGHHLDISCQSRRQSTCDELPGKKTIHPLPFFPASATPTYSHRLYFLPSHFLLLPMQYTYYYIHPHPHTHSWRSTILRHPFHDFITIKKWLIRCEDDVKRKSTT